MPRLSPANWDSPPVGFTITTAAVANGQYQGGGIRIAPEASLEDGLADITLVERVSLAEVAANLAIRFSTADGSYRYCCTSRLKIALFGHCASPITIFVGFASATPIVRSGTRTSKKCAAA